MSALPRMADDRQSSGQISSKSARIPKIDILMGVHTYLNIFTAETSLLSNKQSGVSFYVQQMTSTV
jgi:hypothetical protein